MANEIQIAHGITGQTLYANIRSKVGTIWDGSAFVTYNGTNWTSYDVALVEETLNGSSGYYKGDFPLGIMTADTYNITIRAQSGGSPAVTDSIVGSGSIDWNGSAILTPGTLADNAITAAKIADGAIDQATFATDTGLASLHSGTAQGSSAGSITLSALASSTDNYYIGAMVIITSQTGVGQSRLITAYNGTTKVALTSPSWITNPDNTSVYSINSHAFVNLTPNAITSATIASSAISRTTFSENTGLRSSDSGTVQGTNGGLLVTLDFGASNVNDYYNGQRFIVTGGTGVGQSRLILDYDGSSHIITMDSALATSVMSSNYAIVPIGSSEVRGWIGSTPSPLVTGLVQALTSGALTQADIRTAIGLASANLDIQLALIDDFLDTEIGAIKTKTDQLTFTTANRLDAQVFGMETDTISSAALSSGAVDEIWDEVMEGTTTARQSVRLANSANGGKISGAATTNVLIRDVADTKNRVDATVDSNGNRSTVILDLT